jgi:hypothetical protein
VSGKRLVVDCLGGNACKLRLVSARVRACTISTGLLLVVVAFVVFAIAVVDIRVIIESAFMHEWLLLLLLVSSVESSSVEAVVEASIPVLKQSCGMTIKDSIVIVDVAGVVAAAAAAAAVIAIVVKFELLSNAVFSVVCCLNPKM